ncbi:hypothetical protein chiPu_0009768 [Chiloscyllium punctatum]|uniref:Uncharacterized protein n=1 Tax=Chiloscyllium punctatum TaxID=137246 RepID=A0A401SLQ9_CHIPU|nr:hypothetical protein [Chiloscyllium punctatum]
MCGSAHVSVTLHVPFSTPSNQPRHVKDVQPRLLGQHNGVPRPFNPLSLPLTEPHARVRATPTPFLENIACLYHVTNTSWPRAVWTTPPL